MTFYDLNGKREIYESNPSKYWNKSSAQQQTNKSLKFVNIIFFKDLPPYSLAQVIFIYCDPSPSLSSFNIIKND